MDPYEGFREFVHSRGGALARAAFLLTGDRSSAEDLVQSALVKTAVRWRRVVSGGDPEAYVRRIMVNDHISWWRRIGRRESSRPQTPDPVSGDLADGLAQRIDLAAALANLPPRQRAVIVLRYYQDLSEAQTAATLGCAVGTVKSQAAEGLSKLRRLMISQDGRVEASR